MKLRQVLPPTDRASKLGVFRYISGNRFQDSNALYSHVFMLIMFACMRNDLILHLFLTRSDLKSIYAYTPTLRVNDLRWIRYVMLESKRGEMSHRVKFIALSNG